MNPVYLEISGACNANCVFCPGSPYEYRKAFYMAVGVVEDILVKLKSDNYLKSNVFCPFNSGEPMLHPDLSSIFDVVKMAGLKMNISSNMISYPGLDQEELNILSQFEISVSGFSNETYRINHRGGKIEKVIKNILRLKKERESAGFSFPIKIRWHRYKYNEFELEKAKEYFSGHGIGFFDYYAYFGGPLELEKYYEGGLSNDKLTQIKERINLDFMEMAIESNAGKNFCPIHDTMVLDEYGRVLVCCAVSNRVEDNVIGNYLEMTKEQIERKKRSLTFCHKCMQKGWAGFLTTPKRYEEYAGFPLGK